MPFLFENFVIFPLDSGSQKLDICLPWDTGEVWRHFWLSHWGRDSAPGIQEVKTGMLLSAPQYTGQAPQKELSDPDSPQHCFRLRVSAHCLQDDLQVVGKHCAQTTTITGDLYLITHFVFLLKIIELSSCFEKLQQCLVSD